MGGLGDGGLVTVSARLRGMRDLGRYSHARYPHDGWGRRARLDEFTAAECLLEFAELEVWNRRHRQIVACYSAALAHSVVRPPFAASGRDHAYFNYVVQSPSVTIREPFEQHLRGRHRGGLAIYACASPGAVP